MGTEIEHKLEKIETHVNRAYGYAEEAERKRNDEVKHEFMYNDLWWVRYHLEQIRVLLEE